MQNRLTRELQLLVEVPEPDCARMRRSDSYIWSWWLLQDQHWWERCLAGLLSSYLTQVWILVLSEGSALREPGDRLFPTYTISARQRGR